MTTLTPIRGTEYVAALDEVPEDPRGRNSAPNGAEGPIRAIRPDNWPIGVRSEPLADLLDDIKAYYEKYIVFGLPSQASALSLWAMYTHCFAVGQPYSFVPYVLVTSAEPLSGKSTILELTNKLVHEPLDAQDVTPALIGRTVAGKTLLLDEIDGVYEGRETDAESKATNLRTILNSGFKSNGTYKRLVKSKGGDFEPKEWSTFGPKILAGIGRGVPDTVQTRSIRLRIARKTAETPAAKARDRFLSIEAGPLKGRMQVAAAIIGELPFIEDMPEELGPRDQDLWEPLFALARLAGNGWDDVSEAAAIELSYAEPVMSIGMRLLSDLRDLFADEGNPDFLTTKEMIGHPVDTFDQKYQATGLCSFEESPWAAFARNKPMTPRNLAEELGKYDIKSARPALGRHDRLPSGYYRADFEKAWEAYLEPKKEQDDAN